MSNPISAELANLLEEAYVKEELAIPLYTSHIKNALFWSALPKDVQKKIIETLMVLEQDSEYHAKAIRKVQKLLSA